MAVNKKWVAGAVAGVCAVSLGFYAVNGSNTASTLDEAVQKYDSMESGDVNVDYNINSSTYGDYKVSLTGQFGKTAEAPKETKDSSVADSSKTEEADSSKEEDSEEAKDSSATEGSEEEAKTLDKSRLYDYHLVEDTKVYVDGQETNSTSDVYAIGNTLFDKVFLTGSEADGKFVYDTRDSGVVEYPIATYLQISPIIEAFDLDGVSVEKGTLHNGDKGHVFTLTPEQVATALQGEEGETGLGQNILGLVSEANVDEVVIGVNATTFSIEAVSTGENDKNDEPTSASSDTKTAKTEKDGVIGYLVVDKKAGKVEITEPTNKLDLEEFSALVELYYQQMAEDSGDGALEEAIDADTVYGDGEPAEDADTEESTDSEETVSEDGTVEIQVEDAE